MSAEALTATTDAALAPPDLSGRGSSLVVTDLRVRYGDVEAVHGISFSIEKGKFLTLLGPSGCGKSTTLRCIAGLESPSGGTIAIDGEVVASAKKQVAPEKRGINMVFQSYAVWPHMTVAQNVAYGLGGMPRPEIAERTAAALARVGLAPFAKRYGTELSGGQQQRVAVARAIVTEPKVILFDEPLSNLDAGLRERMRYELLELQEMVGLTSVYVTHDQTEAMSMSDHVVLMNQGTIEQEAAPEQLYRRPATAFAARFLGHANLLDGTLDASGRVLRIEGSEITATSEDAFDGPGGSPANAVFRAEDLLFGDAAKACENVWSARIERVAFLGSRYDVHLTVEGRPMRADVRRNVGLTPGTTVTVGVSAADLHFVPADDPAAS